MSPRALPLVGVFKWLARFNRQECYGRASVIVVQASSLLVLR